MVKPDIRQNITDYGFGIIDNVFSEAEINGLLSVISNVDHSKSTFRKTKELFAIRQFFKEIPEACSIIFTEKFNALISSLFGKEFFVVKSIYFDKPENSNWFVAYHQDLTISVDKKFDIEAFGPWTKKQDQFAVQPSLEILEHNFTVRIHLDDTDNQNGALKVIPGSHLKGVYRPETIDWSVEKEVACNVSKGGIMIMKPLILHSSGKSLNSNKRRVIHIEFSRKDLPQNLNWSEKLEVV